MGRNKMTPEKFWQKVDKNGPIPPHRPELGRCWIWTGCKSKSGYGVTSLNSKYKTAHRLAWEFTHGPIPDGLCVLHFCDHPPCVRHLFLGTNDDNSKDMVDKNRQSQGAKHSAAVLPNRQRGEAHYAHKVTRKQAIEMRRLYTDTKIPIREIAAKFGLAVESTEKLVRGETWKCLGPVELPKKRAAKLSEDTVREIRWLRTTGLTVKQIAHHFKFSIWTVNDIVYRRTWKDI